MRYRNWIVIAATMALIHGCGVHQEMIELEISGIDMEAIEDGSYPGEYDRHRWYCNVMVDVKAHRIDTIEILGSANGTKKLNRELVDRVLEAQTPNVDAVSGATITSNTCLKAIENALLGALAE